MAYGIKVSRPGKSITSTDPRDIILDTTKPLLKIKQAGTGTLSVTGAATSDTDTITHSLGYYPVAMAWCSTSDNAHYVIAHSGIPLGASSLFSAITTTSNLQLYTGRYMGYPAGDFSVYYKYLIFYDPDYSITGVGSTTINKDDMGFLVSKPGIEVDDDIDEDDVILNSKYRCPSIVSVKTGTITVSGGAGTSTIAHGRNGIPCFIPYIELTSGNWYIAASKVTNASRSVTISAIADSTNVVFNVSTGTNATYNIKYLVLSEMISGTGGDADDSESYGMLVSKPSSTASSDLADKDRVFYSGNQHFQPYTTKSFSFRMTSSDSIKTSSSSHGFTFEPAFTARYRFKYPDYGNTWTEWMLMPRTPVDASDFGLTCCVTSSNAIIISEQNTGMGGVNIDFEIEVMIYPIDIG